MSVNAIETVDADINMDFKFSQLRSTRNISHYQDEYDILWALSEDLISSGLSNFDQSIQQGALKISCLTLGIQRMYRTMLRDQKYSKLFRKFNLNLILKPQQTFDENSSPLSMKSN